MGLREWVILLALIFIVVLSVDAVRRMRRQRRFHGRYTQPRKPSGGAGNRVATRRVRLDEGADPRAGAAPRGDDNEVPMLMESVDAAARDETTAHAGQSPSEDTTQYEFDLPPATPDADPFLSIHGQPAGTAQRRRSEPPPRAPTAATADPAADTDTPAHAETAAPRHAAATESRKPDEMKTAPAPEPPEEVDPHRGPDAHREPATAPEPEAADNTANADLAEYNEVGNQLRSDPDEVLVITVFTERDTPYEGPALLQIMLACGMRFGAHNIFHAIDDKGQLQYSAANALKPGTFDLEHIDTFSTCGVTFFLQLPCRADPMTAFDSMYQSATTLASYLGGEIQDESRSVMTTQTLAHYRERIRDYQRSQLVPRN